MGSASTSHEWSRSQASLSASSCKRGAQRAFSMLGTSLWPPAEHRAAGKACTSGAWAEGNPTGSYWSRSKPSTTSPGQAAINHAQYQHSQRPAHAHLHTPAAWRCPAARTGKPAASAPAPPPHCAARWNPSGRAATCSSRVGSEVRAQGSRMLRLADAQAQLLPGGVGLKDMTAMPAAAHAFQFVH